MVRSEVIDCSMDAALELSEVPAMKTKMPAMKTAAGDWITYAASILLLLSLAATSSAQDWKGKGRVQGQVVDPEGQPVEGVEVSLHRGGGSEGPGPKPFTTNKKGRWSYLGLTGGAWTLVLKAEGYLISEGTMQVNEFGPPASPVRIELKRPSAAQLQNEAADLIDQGNLLMQDAKYAEARGLYEEALEHTPEGNRAPVMRGIAQSFAREGNRDAALEMLEKSLVLAPDDSDTLRLIIDILLEAGRDEEAKAYIARLPQGESLDSATRLNLGIELYNQGDLEGALVHFEQAIKDYPKQGFGYYYRGLIALAQGNNDAALSDLKTFLELDPESDKVAEAQQFVEYLEGL